MCVCVYGEMMANECCWVRVVPALGYQYCYSTLGSKKKTQHGGEIRDSQIINNNNYYAVIYGY